MPSLALLEDTISQQSPVSLDLKIFPPLLLLGSEP